VPLVLLSDGKESALTVAPGKLGIQTGRGTARAAWQSGFGQTIDEQLQAAQRRGGPDLFEKLQRLTHTRDEVAKIAATFRRADGTDRVRTLLGGDASEANLFALAGKARYLHIATHGIAHESETASFSALALTSPTTASAADDGFLKLTDLLTQWGQRLPACRMVVLSACRTHVGPQARDEAPSALPTGFLYAGASSVVATHWMVPDRTTAMLMEDFYVRIRAQGDRPDRLAALTAAKKALRAQYPNPYYWAAFAYIGSPQ
jgi:CHAT domain-containing protein